MDLEDCLGQIEAKFGHSQGHQASLTPGEYLSLLEPIANQSDNFFLTLPKSVHKFLYFGTAAFDRWVTPTPIVVEPTLNDNFLRFLEVFKRASPFGHPNLATLLFHQFKTELFTAHAVNLVERKAIDDHELSRLQRQIEGVSIPQVRELRASALQLREQLIAACEGVRRGTIRSVLSTVLPHAVVRAPFSGKGTWRGIEFTYQLAPDALHAEGMTVGLNMAVSLAGLARGSTGACKVTVEVSGLVDHSAWTPNLASTTAPDMQIHTGQPFAQTFLYYLLTDLFATLQTDNSPYVDELWILTPRDIVNLQIEVSTDSHKLVTIPMLMLNTWQVIHVPDGIQQRDVPDLRPAPYWITCRRQARGYLTLGATREALLWLNMAAESLIDDRVASFIEAVPDLRENIKASRLLFQEAEETLAAQFPEMAGRVTWPDREVQPSRYAQLKALYRYLDLGGSFSKAKSCYSLISKSRNPVIHGRNTGLVPVKDVEDGLRALQWLDENLQLRYSK